MVRPHHEFRMHDPRLPPSELLDLHRFDYANRIQPLPKAFRFFIYRIKLIFMAADRKLIPTNISALKPIKGNAWDLKRPHRLICQEHVMLGSSNPCNTTQDWKCEWLIGH